MEGNTDLFRDVEESLLVKIVGFLPFKEAARTSVLSKRWRDIWKETEVIEFNENHFIDQNADNQTKHYQRIHFVIFMNKFINNFPTTAVIGRFALKFSDPANFSRELGRILNFAFSHIVKHLELDFSRVGNLPNRVTVMIPPQAYKRMSVNLESLKLFSCDVELSNLINFTMLKELSLGWININNSLLNSLLTNCPLLEDLSLSKCWGIDRIHISNENLKIKRLVLDGCAMDQDSITIDGPKLEFFKYYGVAGVFSLKNQSALKVAEIDCGVQDEFVEAGNQLCELLHGLYAVEDLTVSSTFLQMVATGDFHYGLDSHMRVKNLNLKTAFHNSELFGIRFMINSCTELETLTIEIGPEEILPAEHYMPPYESSYEVFEDPDYDGEYLLTSLTVVNVKGFSGSTNELMLLSYLICFGRVMQQLNVYVAAEGDQGRPKMARAKLLRRFQKASPNLHISIA